MMDDRFFYAFIGLVIFAGLLGLVWPFLILWDRLNSRVVTRSQGVAGIEPGQRRKS